MVSDFVKPVPVRVPLEDGRWIDVKARLNAGETRAMFARLLQNDMAVSAAGTIHGEVQIDALQAGHSQVLAYLLDWSLVDDDGHPVPIKGQPLETVTAALDALAYDTYQEIVAAVQAHDAAVGAARAAEKKKPIVVAAIRNDLTIARRCGWRYEWVAELDPLVYEILTAQLRAEDEGAALEQPYGH